MSDEHGPVEEPVTIIHSFTDKVHPEAEAAVRKLAGDIATDMGQEQVSTEMHGGLHFVPQHGGKS